MRRTTFEERSSGGGICLGTDYCREAYAAGLTDVACVYSDWTEFVDGPPEVEACPPAPDELAPFCGAACSEDGCPYHNHGLWGGEWHFSCVGVNEERGLGICAFGGRNGCAEGSPGYAATCEAFYGRPCACLRQRLGDGTLDERGFVTMASSCLAYRAMYPSGVECMNPETWSLLP